MIIGNVTKGDTLMSIRPKGKQLTNMRASNSDEAIRLKMALEVDIERGLEIMSDGDYLEITPKKRPTAKNC